MHFEATVAIRLWFAVVCFASLARMVPQWRLTNALHCGCAAADQSPTTMSFANDVVPVLTKAGLQRWRLSRPNQEEVKMVSTFAAWDW